MTFNFGLAGLLDRVAATLDLPPALQEEAERQYGLVGQFLSDQAATADWDIYPQGSMRLGTVVRPITDGEGFDLDMVCQVCMAKESTTQAELVKRVGTALAEYVAAHNGADGAPEACKPKRRCWALHYPGDFHMDVLPSLPDPDTLTGILLTDKELHEWQYSDPKAYASWFRKRMEQEWLRQRKVLAAELRKSVEAVPEWQVRTTLQRTVQLLKRHRDVYFIGDPDDRPPSILITTLAALAYQGEPDLPSALLHAVRDMPNHIKVGQDGRRQVMNPAAPKENFADKWNDYPERETKFLGWLDKVTADIEDAKQKRGIDRVVERLGESFGLGPVTRAAKSLGFDSLDLRDSGKVAVAGATATLTIGAGTRVRPHGFYGDHGSR
jgi:hypothetical protein